MEFFKVMQTAYERFLKAAITAFVISFLLIAVLGAVALIRDLIVDCYHVVDSQKFSCIKSTADKFKNYHF